MRISPVIATATVAATLAALPACSEFKGPLPPDDALYYPVGVSVHPSGDYVYVANSNFDAQHRTDVGGTITVLDADTMELLSDATIRIGSFAGGLLYRSDADSTGDRLYAAVRGDDSLVALAVSDDGSRVTCPNAPAGVRDALRCRVIVAPDPFALTSVDLPDTADGDADLIATVGIDGDVSYVTLHGNADTGYLVDDAYVRSETVLLGASTVRYLPEADEVWIAGRFSRRIRSLAHVFNAEAETEAEVVDVVVTSNRFVPSTFDTAEVRDMILAPEVGRAFITLNRPSAILTLDMTSDDDGNPRGTVLERFDVDGSPAEGVYVREAGRGVLYVALSNDEAIAAYDAATGTLLDVITLDGLAYGLTHDPVRQRLYVTVFDEHAVVAIDVNPTSSTFRHVVARTR